LDFINCILKFIYNSLNQHLNYSQLNDLINDIHLEIENTKILKFNKVKSKLDGLVKTRDHYAELRKKNSHKKFSHFVFHDRIKNLSNTEFGGAELDILKLGLKHCFFQRISDNDLLHFSVEVDTVIEQISKDFNLKKSLRNDIFNILHEFKVNNKRSNTLNTEISHTHLKSLTTKIKNNNLLISKADKGNCLVILEQNSYISKVESFLAENNFKILPANPFNTFIRKVSRLTKHFSAFLEENDAPYTLTPSNPTMPRLYGLPKIHKINVPIRPVLSFTNTPVSFLASFILRLISNLSGFSPKFGIKNSLELTQKLSQIQLPDSFLIVSFDVTNLFTTVPKNETVEIIKNYIKNKTSDQNMVSVVT